MATAPETIDDLLALLKPLGGVTAKKMFGEYCVYLDDKPVGLVCDDCLYVKVTEPGRAMRKNISESPPYPGAKPHLEYPIDSWGNGRHLCEVLRATYAALPMKKERNDLSKSGNRTGKSSTSTKSRKPSR